MSQFLTENDKRDTTTGTDRTAFTSRETALDPPSDSGEAYHRAVTSPGVPQCVVPFGNWEGVAAARGSLSSFPFKSLRRLS